MNKNAFFILSLCLFLCISCKNTEESTESAEVKSAMIAKGASVNVQVTPKYVSMKTIDEVMGKFDPKEHKDFVLIDAKYADQSDRIMHREAYDSFKKMWDHANRDGIKLTIKSATRNFNYQRGIWERKWTGQRKVEGERLNEHIHDHKTRALKILEYSSMPGTSRHHWGTDIDLNAFENNYFESGKGKKEYDWLVQNAAAYGFCQPYTSKGADRPNGYNEEKWHWSYLPVANQYLNEAKENMNDSMITDFKGSETAVSIGVVEKYILGINKSCKQ